MCPTLLLYTLAFGKDIKAIFAMNCRGFWRRTEQRMAQVVSFKIFDVDCELQKYFIKIMQRGYVTTS